MIDHKHISILQILQCCCVLKPEQGIRSRDPFEGDVELDLAEDTNPNPNPNAHVNASSHQRKLMKLDENNTGQPYIALFVIF